MLTGKQKSYLRSLAQTIKPIFQIGKEGLTEAVFASVDDYLLKNELMKVSLLDTCPMEKEEVVTLFSEHGIEVVQVIGKTIVLYHANKKLKEGIRLPR